MDLESSYFLIRPKRIKNNLINIKSCIYCGQYPIWCRCPDRSEDNTKMVMIVNHIIPWMNFQEWHEIIQSHKVMISNPPPELHLNIDITKLNQDDIDWIKIHYRQLIPELKILLDQHNKKIKEYRKTIQEKTGGKISPPIDGELIRPKIMKKAYRNPVHLSK